MSQVRILVGHVLDKLRELPADSVHMVWSSPPYWGLRCYGTEPQVWGGQPDCKHDFGRPHVVDHRHKIAGEARSTLEGGKANQRASQYVARSDFCVRCGAWRGEHGLEPTLELWLQHEVLIWREVRRVLRPDGTAWINVGDAYATAPNGRSAAAQKAAGTDDRTFRDKPLDTSSIGLASKQRLMLPARLALALQADGWFLRDEIVWCKANPMPSSVRDRTTPAHEMLYLLSKKPRYFFDDVAIQEPCAVPDWDNGTRVYGGANAKQSRTTGRVAGYERPDGWATHEGGHGSIHRGGREKGEPNAAPAQATRRKRSVWHMALEPLAGAHFATAPTGLVRPCILAGTSARGVCPRCGAPWVRVTERVGVTHHGGGRRKIAEVRDDLGATSCFNTAETSHYATVGWSASCDCDAGDPIPATVLDPFGGSGTTGLVAEELGRDAILIELNPEYARMARDRIGLFAQLVPPPQFQEAAE